MWSDEQNTFGIRRYAFGEIKTDKGTEREYSSKL